jgi:glutathione synthase
MTIKLGVLMNAIETIKPREDSTLAMLYEAQKRGWEIYYLQRTDLFLINNIVSAHMWRLQVAPDVNQWFTYHDAMTQPLHELDIILMRLDPPINMHYIYLTYLLEKAQQQGVFVMNHPSSLRNLNEKIFAAAFAHLMPDTLIACDMQQLKNFLYQKRRAVIKPLHSMGGDSVFLMDKDNRNTNVILETMTHRGTRYVLIQQYLTAAEQGDKRILLLNGEPVPYALLRTSLDGEFRNNLAAGASFKIAPLTEQDKKICQEVGGVLKEKGLLFVGIDIIGDYLIEINITSPGCLMNIEKHTSYPIAKELFDLIAQSLSR